MWASFVDRKRRKREAERKIKTPYTCKPLTSATNFRIMHLQPGNFNDDVWFSLREHAIDENVEFSAVSYAWNSVELSHTIYSADGYMKVTRNLFNALQRYRLVTESIYLWVDAVCISQDDPVEKAQQVQLMGNIFSRTCETFIWLGEEMATDKTTFAYVKESVDKYWQRLNSDITNRYAVMLEILSGLENSDHGIGISALLQRSWFSRAWTYQEILCARKATLSCGRLDLDYEILFNFAIIWNIDPVYLRALTLARARQALQHIAVCWIQREAYRNGSPHLTFVGLVHSGRYRDSTDPRDKIYSLLGIASQPEPLPYAPSYIISTEELYRDFAIHIIRQRNDLEVFKFCHFKREEIAQSSWVPDWRTECPAHMQGDKVKLFNACKSHQLRLFPSQTRMELVIEGLILDEISCLSLTKLDTDNVSGLFDPTWTTARSATQYAFIMETLAIASRSVKYRDNEERHEACWRTLVGDRINDVRRATSELQRDFQIHVSILALWGAGDYDTVVSEEEIRKHIDFERMILSQAALRRFCLTKEGRLGWVCKNARVGDKVGILFGSSTPVLLRPKGDSFLMLEQCYIHGIMDGEFMVEGCPLQTRPICLI